MVERGGVPAGDVSRLTWPAARLASLIGLTGAPGAGKSTLTNMLVRHVRDKGERVAVLAIDPSSPFTNGAILGDRVRMQDHATDDGVFIRSMATRGQVGGLALATPEAARVLAAAGYPTVLIETVGVGQVEVEIAGAADTTVVVVNPGWGDAVQANKAGLLEVADVFVINKADRPGVAEVHRDLEAMLDMHVAPGPWRPPIVEAIAARGEGAAAVWEAIDAHRAHMVETGELARRQAKRAAAEVREIVVRTIEAKAVALLNSEKGAALTARVTDGSIDPHAAAGTILRDLEA
ncbi:MAG: methylmalonyl Co-A mutase-associated GTPase MeaB [Actinobacteria bacterium]|nr:methylmalonyl Co-A mutase-associated GTPase MeaB [Actinomycetota bacterium]MBA3655193.1 methylmalonyl Co-A mutase-associated GTPase MeaB [Actinomycetota bacterium]